MNEELSTPAKDCLTRNEYLAAREADPVHVVAPECVVRVGET